MTMRNLKMVHVAYHVVSFASDYYYCLERHQAANHLYETVDVLVFSFNIYFHFSGVCNVINGMPLPNAFEQTLRTEIYITLTWLANQMEFAVNK